MWTVSEVSRMSGVSVRTLHHYDAIGLLKPAEVTQAGYRMYDGQALRRLQTILLFRELQFPLREIKALLDRPGFDSEAVLGDQIRLLQMRRRRLDDLIALARKVQKTGVTEMDFAAFDRTEIDRYTEEAREKWGKTDAWKEYEQKSAGKLPGEMKKTGEALMDIFREMGELTGQPPECGKAQALVEKLRAFITAHYYTCTPQILRGLGQMYAAGGEMTDNIDAAGGAGTAEFAHRAIEKYTEKI